MIDTQPPGPADAPTPAPSGRRRTLLLLAAVVAVGLLGVGLTVASGRTDSALLFVGVPCVMALGVGLVRGRGGWGTVFQVVTVVLLLVSALLQEAAVCVLIAAPLVYGCAALVYAVSRHDSKAGRVVVATPLMAVVLLEGVVPGARVHPVQEASATRVVGADCAVFAAGLAGGPRIDPERDRGRLLKVFPYPTPTAATGTGLARGDTWDLQVAGGELRTRIDGTGEDYRLFTVVADTSRLERWVTVREGVLRWDQEGGRCRATMRVTYERHLDPAMYFGPVSDVFMDAGTAAFLAAMD